MNCVNCPDHTVTSVPSFQLKILDSQQSSPTETKTAILNELALPPLPPFESTRERDVEVEYMMNVQRKRICDLTLEDIECMEKYYLIPEAISDEYNTAMFNESSLFLLMLIERPEKHMHDLINSCVHNEKYMSIEYAPSSLTNRHLKYLMYTFIKQPDRFARDLNRKPPVFKLVTEIMSQWKKDHVNTINQVILHSSLNNNFQTTIFYTDSLITKKKLPLKRSKPQFVIKQYDYGILSHSFNNSIYLN